MSIGEHDRPYSEIAPRAGLYLDHLAQLAIGAAFLAGAYLVLWGLDWVSLHFPLAGIDQSVMRALRILAALAFALVGVGIIIADTLLALVTIVRHVREEVRHGS